MSESSATFFGPWGPLYDMLQHLKASKFRKVHRKSGNSSKTAHSCNTEHVVNFCTLMLENLCKGSQIFNEWPNTGLNLALCLKVCSLKHRNNIKEKAMCVIISNYQHRSEYI